MFSRRKTRRTRGRGDNSSSSISAPVPTGDASLWFSRMSGSVASTKWFDITVNGNDGTPSAAALMGTFQFDGATTEVTTAFAAPLTDNTKPWSLQAWITRDAAGAMEAFQVRAGDGWVLRDSPIVPADMDFATFNPFANNTSVFTDLLGGAWFHIVLTWTPGAPATLLCYLNGVLNATKTPANYGAGGTLLIGNGANDHWNGKIDTVRVFSRVLSADEILRDYNAGLPAHP